MGGYVPPPKPQGGQRPGDRRIGRAGGEEGGVLLRGERAHAVGVHAQRHQRVGLDEPQTCRSKRQPRDAARQRHGHRRREAAHSHGDEKLHRADRHPAASTHQEPARQLRGQGRVKAGIQPAHQVEYARSGLRQKRKRRRHRQLAAEDHPQGHGAAYERVPVVFQVLQPPQVGAQHAKERGHEEKPRKQRVLRPKAVPLFRENAGVA